MYPPILRVHLKKKEKDKRTYLMMLLQCFGVCLFFGFFIKAFVVGTDLIASTSMPL